MPSTPSLFIVNEPSVSYETIGSEVIIVNLSKGHYYSLEGTGARIWELISQRQPYSAILSYCLNHYEGPQDHIEGSVHEFIGALVEHDIIVPSEDKASSSHPIILSENKEFFSEPILDIYTDMEELLLNQATFMVHQEKSD